MGSLGPYNLDVMHFCRLRIYYKPTKVEADTLYFQSQQEFVFEQLRVTYQGLLKVVLLKND